MCNIDSPHNFKITQYLFFYFVSKHSLRAFVLLLGDTQPGPESILASPFTLPHYLHTLFLFPIIIMQWVGSVMWLLSAWPIFHGTQIILKLNKATFRNYHKMENRTASYPRLTLLKLNPKRRFGMTWIKSIAPPKNMVTHWAQVWS